MKIYKVMMGKSKIKKELIKFLQQNEIISHPENCLWSISWRPKYWLIRNTDQAGNAFQIYMSKDYKIFKIITPPDLHNTSNVFTY